MTRRVVVVSAVVASLATWLVPVVGPHAVSFAGVVLAQHGGDPRQKLLQWAAVAAVQLSLFLLLVLLRRLPLAARAAIFAVAWLAAAVALNAAIMVAIPVATLIERETRPERADLPEECRVPGASVDARVGPDGAVLLRPDHGPKLLRLRMPGCVAEPTELDVNATLPVRGDDRSGPRDRRLVVPAGWVAWDLYAEDRRYVVEWVLDGRPGRVEIPRGSGALSAAVDPRGRYVAYSTSTTLNVGSVRDAVVVVRTSDGAEIYRRSLPRYTRSEVALVGEPPRLAATEATGGASVVRLLRLP